jgi:hypothetical protein
MSLPLHVAHSAPFLSVVPMRGSKMPLGKGTRWGIWYRLRSKTWKTPHLPISCGLMSENRTLRIFRGALSSTNGALVNSKGSGFPEPPWFAADAGAAASAAGFGTAAAVSAGADIASEGARPETRVGGGVCCLPSRKKCLRRPAGAPSPSPAPPSSPAASPAARAGYDARPSGTIGRDEERARARVVGASPQCARERLYL